MFAEALTYGRELNPKDGTLECRLREWGDPVQWDWGRLFGAKPGEYRTLGTFVVLGWLTLGLVQLLLVALLDAGWFEMAIGAGWVLLGLVGLGLAAGIIPGRHKR